MPLFVRIAKAHWLCGRSFETFWNFEILLPLLATVTCDMTIMDFPFPCFPKHWAPSSKQVLYLLYSFWSNNDKLSASGSFEGDWQRTGHADVYLVPWTRHGRARNDAVRSRVLSLLHITGSGAQERMSEWSKGTIRSSVTTTAWNFTPNLGASRCQVPRPRLCLDRHGWKLCQSQGTLWTAVEIGSGKRARIQR